MAIAETKQWEFEWFFITEVADNGNRDGKRLFTINDREFKMKKSKIIWHKDLNCYAFMSAPKIYWNVKAMSDIVEFINGLEEE